jgi:thioredoxin 1
MTDAQGAVHLTEKNFAEMAKAAGTPVFVDFYATWCGPCKLAAPIVDKLATEFKGKVLVAKLDVDENGAIAQKYGVMSIPTVILFKQEGEELKEVARQVGFPGEQGYRKLLEKVL